MNYIKSEAHGIWRIIPSMALTEIIGQSKFHFQILDCEHGAYDYHTLQQDIRICHLHNNSAYVRVSGLNKVEVQRCLDLGADGIVFPQLNDFQDFEIATKLIQYAPNGLRGFNPFVPAGEYGFGDIHRRKVECIAIIETLLAVDQLDQILTLNNLDMLYIGVYDLSAQIGKIGVMDDAELITIVDTIIEKCNRVGKRVSLMVHGKSSYEHYKAKGVYSFVHTIEGHQIKSAFTNLLTTMTNG